MLGYATSAGKLKYHMWGIGCIFTRVELYKLEGITTMNKGVDFTPDIPDAFLFHFVTLVLTPTVQEATTAGAEQQPPGQMTKTKTTTPICQWLSIQLSPRKPKLKPGPMRT